MLGYPLFSILFLFIYFRFSPKVFSSIYKSITGKRNARNNNNNNNNDDDDDDNHRPVQNNNGYQNLPTRDNNNNRNVNIHSLRGNNNNNNTYWNGNSTQFEGDENKK